MSKTPKMPGSGGSYVRNAKGALICKEATKPADTAKKPPAPATPAPNEKEA